MIMVNDAVGVMKREKIEINVRWWEWKEDDNGRLWKE